MKKSEKFGKFSKFELSANQAKQVVGGAGVRCVGANSDGSIREELIFAEMLEDAMEYGTSLSWVEVCHPIR